MPPSCSAPARLAWLIEPAGPGRCLCQHGHQHALGYFTTGDSAGVSTWIGTVKSWPDTFLGTGEIGSPAQLVSTCVHRIRCQRAKRNRASAPPMLQLDTLMSGNSAT